MGRQPILLWGDPRLVAPNEPVEAFGQELHTLVTEMFETSWAAPGLGLAAPQIGINLRLAVLDLSVGKDPEQRTVLANPEITSQEYRMSMEEGCLSFPGLFTTFERPKSITVRAQDATGKWREIHGQKLLAQALCHEIDHLNGILLIDHIRGLKRKMFVRRVKKLQKAGAWG
ncbi:MAG: peptide deformylase [Acidobacteria bacterium]|nr:MAG: peptide deformylase [Acidobacteriota bacterium]RLE32732.1 MAG: peptide deformylase [Acidobacteriota bacterium]